MMQTDERRPPFSPFSPAAAGPPALAYERRCAALRATTAILDFAAVIDKVIGPASVPVTGPPSERTIAAAGGGS